MAIAGTLKQFLKDVRVHYQLLPHGDEDGRRHSGESTPAAEAALAKPILFKDRRGYVVLAVVPATHLVDVARLCSELHRELEPADDRTVRHVFRDCEIGAIPPIGQAYGVDVIWDDSLLDSKDVYFEAGDQARLVHVSGADFRRLMASMEHSRISQPAA